MLNFNVIYSKIENSKHPVFYTGEKTSILNTKYESSICFSDKIYKNIFNLDFFNSQPVEFYKSFNKLFLNLKAMKPNYIYSFLSKLPYSIITENINGIHQEIGKNYVIELQGNINKLLCPYCNFSIPTYKIFTHILNDQELKAKILCPKCYNILKTNLVLLGEVMENYNIALELIEKSDLLIVIGSSLSIWPANTLISKAREQKIEVIIIND